MKNNIFRKMLYIISVLSICITVIGGISIPWITKLYYLNFTNLEEPRFMSTFLFITAIPFILLLIEVMKLSKSLLNDTYLNIDTLKRLKRISIYSLMEFFIYIIALFTRLILLKRMIDFPVFKYLTEVVGRSLLVAALSSIIPLVIFVILNAGFIRFILVTILSLGGTVIISYWIGLNGDERIWIKKQMINHICKLGIKNKRNEK